MKPEKICRKLLLVLAFAFVLSAWLYCLATMHILRSANALQDSAVTSGLMAFFRDNGAKVLAIELVALALCGAIMVFAERQPAAKDEEKRYDEDTKADCRK